MTVELAQQFRDLHEAVSIVKGMVDDETSLKHHELTGFTDLADLVCLHDLACGWSCCPLLGLYSKSCSACKSGSPPKTLVLSQKLREWFTALAEPDAYETIDISACETCVKFAL